MDWSIIRNLLGVIQHLISFLGVTVILFGVCFAFSQLLYYFFTQQLKKHPTKINAVRLNLGRTLILGLEFIVAADLIGTTTTPDYYALGILGIIVIIRTVLSFSLNRELMALSKER